MLLVIYLLVLVSLNRFAAACETIEHLTALTGVVSSPVDATGHFYPTNVDHCWIIMTTELVVIRFVKLDVDPYSTFLRIYENTSELRINISEKYRLTEPDVINSEFWLMNSTLVRFTASSYARMTGCQFKYQIKMRNRKLESRFNGSVEIIRSVAGDRNGHVGSEALKYSSAYVKAWSIYASQDQIVRIKIYNRREDLDEIELRFYAGLYPNLEVEQVHRIEREDVFNRNFIGSVTIMYRTGYTTTGFGINVYFSVDSTILKPSFWSWSSRTGGYLLMLRSPDNNFIRNCTAKLAPESIAVNFTTPSVRWGSNYLYHGYYHKISMFSAPGRESCITGLSCTVNWGFPVGIRDQAVKLPADDPEEIRIDFISPDQWPITGVVHFQTVSDSVCPTVRHRCELRTPDGNSLPAHQINLQVIPTLWLSSVITQFAVSSPSIVKARSVVSCRLTDGGSVVQRLPLSSDSFKIRKVEKTEILTAVWNFTQWIGKAFPISFSISLKPVVNVVRARCTLRHSCHRAYTNVYLEQVGRTKFGANFKFHRPDSGDSAAPCIDKITCNFSGPAVVDFTTTVEPPAPDPHEIQIQLQNLHAWSLTRVIQFLAVSESVCPSVRHRCELRTPNGSAFPAQLMRRHVLRLPNVGYTCSSSVMSEFAVAANPQLTAAAGSLISCSRRDGLSAVHWLPELTFDLPHIEWNLASRPASNSFSVSLTPALRLTDARCKLYRPCGVVETILLKADVLKTISANLTVTTAEFKPSKPTSLQAQCISNISCSFQAVGMKKIELSFAVPAADPEAIAVELIDPNLWSLTGVIQFRAVSDSICPSERHYCELQIPGSSSLPAHQINFLIDEPSKPECRSSVTSHFALPSPSALPAYSTIACRLADGGFKEQRLPLLTPIQSRLAGRWERPLQIGASVVAVIAIVVLACILLCHRESTARRRRNRTGDVLMKQSSCTTQNLDRYLVNENSPDVYASQ